MRPELPPAGSQPAGLCDACRHARRIVNDRGSVFVLCERSRTDHRFPRYPRLPVVVCNGFEPPAPGEVDASRSDP